MSFRNLDMQNQKRYHGFYLLYIKGVWYLFKECNDLRRNPSQDSSVGGILASYRWDSGFKSRQGQEFFFNENKTEVEYL